MDSQIFIPGNVKAYGAVPFVFIIVASLVGSFIFMKYFWKKRERDVLCIVVATLGLWLALLTSFLLPFEVFLLSYMKDSDGNFKDWATNETRTSVENGMTYTYYAAYSLILLFAFFLLPFVYFFHEEKNENLPHKSKRFLVSLCYSGIFLFGAVILLVTGALLPYRKLSGENGTAIQELDNLFNEVYQDKGADALYFTFNILMSIGMVMILFYTGFGLSSYPMSFMKGFRSIKAETKSLEEQKAAIAAKRSALQSKPSLSSKQQQRLKDLDEEEHFVQRMENELDSMNHGGWTQKLSPFFNACGIIYGFLSMCIGVLIWLSLLFSMVDKVINSLGYKEGYLVSIAVIPNPLNYILVQCQKVFPIDFIFYFGIVLFLLFCTVGGIREVGICCFCIRLFTIRRQKTQPQALIMLCGILMYCILGLNYVMYTAAPQYTTYGSQHYFNATSNTTETCNSYNPEECMMTRASFLFLGFTTKAWIFAVVYFWMMWGFLVLTICGFVYFLVRDKKSFILEAVDKDDFDDDSDSDTQPILP